MVAYGRLRETPSSRMPVSRTNLAADDRLSHTSACRFSALPARTVHSMRCTHAGGRGPKGLDLARLADIPVRTLHYLRRWFDPFCRPRGLWISALRLALADVD